jgi:deoxyribodipyrimidine photo-lyase
MSKTIVLWFRQDLRLSDLPALQAACRDGDQVLAVYIHDESVAGDWAPGGASRWWLHHSLQSLAKDIEATGGQLHLRRGDTAETLKTLCADSGADAVYCSRRYEPWAGLQEQSLHTQLDAAGIKFKRFPGTLLHEPGSVLTKNDDPYKVFTPFWRSCQQRPVPPPSPTPAVTWAQHHGSESLKDWALLPTNPDWAQGWESFWSPGEHGARERLQAFLSDAVCDYAEQRDLPAVDATSRLSPHLHHGEISPRQIWALCEQFGAEHPEAGKAVAKFLAELGWREFSYHLLTFFPHIPEQAFKDNFAQFPWRHNPDYQDRWQRGMTGYPIVDAGMRELWATGYMHNRVRMVVASFLCKHLLQHWRVGEDWFWDTLVDADLASNGCSWQWVAGSGADAAPYFRIFNPVTQGEKFDKKGVYVRRWVPELAELPDKYLHKPWEAPEDVLSRAGIDLGATYPEPIVDHREARQAALDAYEAIRASAAPA